MRPPKPRTIKRRQSAQSNGMRLAALDQIRQCAHEIYAAHGGAQAMMLRDWLMAEQELRRKLETEKPLAVRLTPGRGGINPGGDGSENPRHFPPPNE